MIKLSGLKMKAEEDFDAAARTVSCGLHTILGAKLFMYQCHIFVGGQ